MNRRPDCNGHERFRGRVLVPDESGMGEEEIVLGHPVYDPDSRRWVVWESEFFAREATDVEVYRVTHGEPMPMIGWIYYDNEPGSRRSARYLHIGRGRWRCEIGQWGVYLRLGWVDLTVAFGRAE